MNTYISYIHFEFDILSLQIDIHFNSYFMNKKTVEVGDEINTNLIQHMNTYIHFKADILSLQIDIHFIA